MSSNYEIDGQDQTFNQDYNFDLTPRTKKPKPSTGVPTQVSSDGYYDFGPSTSVPQGQGAPPPQIPDQQGPSSSQPVSQNDFIPASPQGGGYDYQKFRDAWQGDSGSMADFLRNHPDISAGVTMSGDKFILPGGAGTMDAIIGSKAGGTAHAWTPTGGAAQNPAYAGAAGAAGGAAGAGGAGSYDDPEIYAAIKRLLAQGEKPVTEEDMMAQFAPVSRTLQRGAQRSREQGAERLAAQGLNQGGAAGGALDANVNAINENLGEQQGNVMAQLMTGELQARRQQVVQALQLAQGTERMRLEKLLADMDQQIKQQQIGLQGRSLDLQGQGLNQQNQQFYDQFGYNAGRDEMIYNLMTANMLGGG